MNSALPDSEQSQAPVSSSESDSFIVIRARDLPVDKIIDINYELSNVLHNVGMRDYELALCAAGTVNQCVSAGSFAKNINTEVPTDRVIVVQMPRDNGEEVQDIADGISTWLDQAGVGGVHVRGPLHQDMENAIRMLFKD